MTINSTLEITTIIVALLNLFGIYYNYKLSKKVKLTDEEIKEKSELRIKIHDRLAEIEEQFLHISSFSFSTKISQRLIYLARRVKVYDNTLSAMIRIFLSSWKLTTSISKNESEFKTRFNNIMSLRDDIESIGDRADLLMTDPSIMAKVKTLFSWVKWVKFRIDLFKSDRDHKKRIEKFVKNKLSHLYSKLLK